MNPEEKLLLQRVVKLSEENHTILRGMQRRARWALAWGFVKVAIIIVPLVVGYFYLEPYVKEAAGQYEGLKSLLNI